MLAELFLPLIAVLAAADAPPFSANVIITRDQYVNSKSDHTLATEGLRLSSASTFYRGEKINIIVVLHGVVAQESTECHVTFDLAITDPGANDPTVHRDLAGRKETILAPENVFIADAIVELTYEDTDPLGEGKVAVTAYDKIGDRQFVTSAGFTLIEYGTDVRVLSQEELDERFIRYYKDPNSHFVFELMKVAFDDSEKARRAGIPMMMGPFFRQIFRDNPYQIPHLGEYLESLEAEKAVFLLPMLKGILEDHPALVDRLPKSINARDRLAKVDYPDIWDDDFTSATELDMLWTHFFATGEIKPIRKLATATELTDHDDEMKKIIGKAALWSLHSNCREHELVRAYCDYLACQDSDLPGTTRAVLAELVKRTE